MVAPLAEYGLLVPTAFNDGQPLSAALRARIENLILDALGGFTVARGLEGAWVAPDRIIYRDAVDAYILAAADEGIVLRLAKYIGRLLRQRSVYIRLPSNHAVILAIGADPEQDEAQSA